MNLKKPLIISITTLFILSMTGFSCQNPAEKTEEITLTIWGVYDNSTDLKDIISSYENLHPNIHVRYYKKVYEDYERELLGALAAGKGPDIFFIHNTWLPKYSDKIMALTDVTPPVFSPLREEQRKGCMRSSTLPPTQHFIGTKEYWRTYVDVVSENFTSNGKIYAVPLACDTLALYYNKELFKRAEITDPPGIPNPPKTWEDFKDDVEKLTILDEKGNIKRAGATLGTAKNINRSTDILTLLMLQSGTQMTDSEHTRATFNQMVRNYYPGQTALQFYTDFANPAKRVYTWNPNMEYSIDAFYQGKAAMMFNYSYHIPTIRAKAPKLDFGVAPVPQIKGSGEDVNFANYWGLTVSRKSPNKPIAWDFIMFASKKENVRKYVKKTKRPSARRDLIEEQKSDEDLGVFAAQVLSAKSWYVVDQKSVETIFVEMIESVVLRRATPREAINLAAAQVSRLMR